jgi:DNA-binding CsgD family transcriptional regulator
VKTTTLKNFAGLTYVTISKVPIKKNEYGTIIDLEPRVLEKIVAIELIKQKIPITGVEFRLLKSAMQLSNESIGQKLGINRNTVLKWGKDLHKRIPKPYEMLVRLLAADIFGIHMIATIHDLEALNKTKKITVQAA